MPPFLLPSLALATGILVGSTFRLPFWSAAVATGCAFGVWAVLRLLARTPRSAVLLNPLHYVWVGLLFLSAGLLAESLDRPAQVDFSQYPEGTRGNARIERLSRKAAGDRFVVSLPDFGVRAILFTGGTTFAPGDEISLPLSFIPVGETTLHPDYRERLLRDGILYSQYVDSSDITMTGHSDDLFTLALSLRDRLEIGVEKSGLSPETVSFLTALLLGDQEFIGQERRELFSSVGLAHILALSGMHVGILVAVLMVLLLPLNFVGKWKVKYPLAILLLWFFVLLSGCSPSTVRAALMTSFCFVAIVSERRRSALNALFFALFVILLFSPSAMFQPSLQLSATCVFCLICFASRLNTFDHRLHPVPFWISATVWPPLVTVGGTWAISAYYFGTLPLMFLPVNLIVVPLLPFFVGAALVYLVLPSAWPPAVWLGKMLDGGTDALMSLCSFFSAGGDSGLHVEPGFLAVTAWSFGLAFLAVSLSEWVKGRWARRIALGCSLMLMAGSVLMACGSPSADAGRERLSLSGDTGIISFVRENGRDVSPATRIRRGTVTSLVAPGGYRGTGASILIVDRRMERRIAVPSGGKRWRYLMICGGCRQSLGEILEYAGADTVLVHGSVWRNHERNLVREGDSLGVPVRPLRVVPGFSCLW